MDSGIHGGGIVSSEASMISAFDETSLLIAHVNIREKNVSQFSIPTERGSNGLRGVSLGLHFNSALYR